MNVSSLKLLTLEVRLLGGFVVMVGEKTIPDDAWRSRRARNLIKLLALAPGHRLARDQVIDALWPDSDLQAAANNLYQTLYAARHILEQAGEACLKLEEGVLSLGEDLAGQLTIDVEQFEAAAVAARKNQDLKAYQAALALYSGDLLPEDLYDEWTLQRRESLRQTYLQLLLEQARLYEGCQAYPAGIEALQRALAVDQSYEEAHAALMRLFALSGQRQQALRQYETLKDILYRELEIEPSESTIQLYQAILAGRVVGKAPVEASPIPSRKQHNLPSQLTSFIGREEAIAEVSRRVKEFRLVTLTGAGGTGKTRLALQVAGGLLEDFPDGVFLVELAPLSDPELLPQACAQVLGVIQHSGSSLMELVAHYLEKKQFLLILDNCEHVVEACVRLADRLLKACPCLHILATSREILSLPGESPYRVPSLKIPRAVIHSPMAELSEIEAVRLFVERAAQVVPEFRLTEENAGAIVQICQRLDGIPLAIELAAVRTRMMAVEQISDRLVDAFRLLTGGSRAGLPRQQTLRAAIDWSYELLPPKERLLLQRLSVFAGGWTLEAAEAIAPGDTDLNDVDILQEDVLDLLARLVDKSLVYVEPVNGSVRYTMLEIIRQYAHGKLSEVSGDQRARDRHLSYYAGLAAMAEPHLRARDQVEWQDRLGEELDNLRLALEWSLKRSAECGLKMLADLMWFWWIRDLCSEGVVWLEKHLAAEAAQRKDGLLDNDRALQRARGLRTLGFLAMVPLTIPASKRLAMIEESVAILRRLGPIGQHELGIALWHLMLERMLTPDEEQEMVAIFNQYHDRFNLSQYLMTKGQLAFTNLEKDQAIQFNRESLSISREIEDIDGVGGRAAYFGFHMAWFGEYAAAESLLAEALEACRKVHNRRWEALVYEYMTELALARGQYAESMRVNDRAMDLYQVLDYRPGMANTLKNRMIIAWSMGDYPLARVLGRKVIEEYPESVGYLFPDYFWLGKVALSEGDLGQAEALFKQSYDYDIYSYYAIPKGVVLLSWAILFQKAGRLSLATRMLGAMDQVYQCIGPGYTPAVRSEHSRIMVELREALGSEVYQAVWKEGQAMTLDQALAEAIASLD